MSKCPVDVNKKKNIKCEHCRFMGDDHDYTTCTNPDSPKYIQKFVNYWNRCKCFAWREDILRGGDEK